VKTGRVSSQRLCTVDTEDTSLAPLTVDNTRQSQRVSLNRRSIMEPGNMVSSSYGDDELGELMTGSSLQVSYLRDAGQWPPDRSQR